MAQFSVKYGLLANKPDYSAAIEGTLLFTTDSHELFANVGGTQFKVGAFDSVANTDALASADTSKMYYVRDIKALAVYNASKSQWEQVNADTGATAVTVVGTGTAGAVATGDVITSASYDAATRTITLTASRVTAANVDRGSNSNVDADLTAVEGRLTILEGSGAGSVAKAVADAVDALEGSAGIASESEGVVTIKAGITEVDGIVSNNSSADITLAKVATTGAAEDVSYGSGSTVKAALDTLNGTDTTAGSVAKAVKDAVDGLDVTEFAIAEKNSSTNVVTIHGAKETDGKIAVGTTAANDITLAAVAATGAAGDVSYSQTIGSTTVTNVDDALDALVIQTAGGVASKTVYMTDNETATAGYLKTYKIYQGSTGSADSPVASELIGTIDIPKDLVVTSGTVETVETADTPYPGAVVGDKYIDLAIANQAEHIYIPAKDLVDIYTAQQNATQVQIVIDGNNVISASIVAGSIDTTEIKNSAVTTAKIADDAVTADKVAIAAHTVSQTAGTDGVAISVTTTDGQVSAVSASIAANTYDSYGAAAAAVAALDADLDASGTAQHSGTFVVSGVTQVDGEITAVDSVEVEAAGAAAAALSTAIGTSSDAASANTINGAKAYADSVVASGLTWGTF